MGSKFCLQFAFVWLVCGFLSGSWNPVQGVEELLSGGRNGRFEVAGRDMVILSSVCGVSSGGLVSHTGFGLVTKNAVLG